MMHRFAAFCLLLAPLGATASPITVKQLLNTTTTVTGERIVLPPNPQLRVSHYTIEPGAVLPTHKHPAQRYAYILSGEIDVTFPDIGKTFHSKAGDFIAEGAGQWHFGTNNGKEPVALLVIDQMPETEASNTVMQDKASTY